MYNNIVNTSSETQKSIYGDAGDQVIDAYIAGKNAAKTKTQIIQDMVTKIETLWPTRVSNHCVSPADYALVNVIDIGYSSVSDIKIFRVQAIWARDNGIIKTFLDEPSNSCFHIEVQN